MKANQQHLGSSVKKPSQVYVERPPVTHVSRRCWCEHCAASRGG